MIYATNVKVCPENLTLTVGKWYYDLCATVEPSNATCKSVWWHSSNPLIVAVNYSNGYVFAKSTGTATIYATACDGSGVRSCCTVTVTEPILATGVNVLPIEAKLVVGASKVLRGIVLPTNATVQCLFWTTSNKNVVTVNPDTGLIYAVSPGTATIHATVCDGSEAHGSCEVTVVPDSVPPTGIELDKTSMTLAIGETAELQKTVYPTEGAVKRAVHWTSSNPQVAEVNCYTGRITALSPGTTTITATTVDGNLSASCQLTVPQPPSWIKLSKVKLTLKVGEIKYLVANIMSEDGVYGSNVHWSSSNSSIASVNSSNGKITALSPGTVTITATTPDGNLSAECTVRVIADTVTISAYHNTNKVVFDSTGKTWYCINHDMLFGEEAWNQSACEARLRFNYFTYYDEEEPNNSDTNPREYTDDEIKLLYAIDPYGVAAYINEYANRKEGGLETTLQHKDRMFRLLFNREPKYFARTSDGRWYETNDKSDLSDVLSESETVFGVHMIRDEYLKNIIMESIDTIIRLGISIAVEINSGVGILNTYKNLETLIKIIIFLGNIKSDGLVRSIIDGSAEPALRKTSLNWAPLIVSIYSTITEIVANFAFETTYYGQVFDYCINELNYEINMHLQSGETYKLQEISDLIANK